MQHIMKLYEQNSNLIEKFIISSLKQINLEHASEEAFRELNFSFPSLELMYECDKNLIQVSPNIGEAKANKEHIGRNRSYLCDVNSVKDSIYISEPYISSATGYLCITVITKHQEGYLFYDFRVRTLLERFHMIEANTNFRRLSRVAYSIIGGGLLIFGLFVALYGLGSFVYELFIENDMSLELVFKPVIALTLGLAVFDLGKTIFEQEVLPRTQNITEVFNPKSLVTFISSIVIALLIEALLIVFKISINHYQDLPYAAILIVAISFLLYVFSRFIPKVSISNEANKS